MNKDKKFFRASCVAFAVSALSILLTFAADYNGNAIAVVFAVLTGALFWLGLVFGIVFLLAVNAGRKANRHYTEPEGTRIGLLTFFSNPYARAVDIAMTVMFILALLAALIPAVGQNVTLVFISLFLLSVYMHAMLNGRNYRYIKGASKNNRQIRSVENE